MISSLLVFAYLGPETMLPVTSVVAGLAGVVMILGRSSLRWAASTIGGFVALARPRSKPRAKNRKIGTGPVNPVERPRVQA